MVKPLYPCNTRLNISTLLFISTKFTLYHLLLERLFTIFEDSKFRMNRCTVYSVRIVMGLLFIVAATIIMTSDSGHVDAEGLCLENKEKLKGSVLKTLFLFADFVFTMFVLNLFSRQILTISMAMHRASMDGASARLDDGMLRVVKKTHLLGITALMTTQLSIIISMFVGGNTWSQMDSMVNSWCIMLMFRSYDRAYRWMCHYALLCASDGCIMVLACYCRQCGRVQTEDEEMVKAELEEQQKRKQDTMLRVESHSPSNSQVPCDITANKKEFGNHVHSVSTCHDIVDNYNASPCTDQSL